VMAVGARAAQAFAFRAQRGNGSILRPSANWPQVCARPRLHIGDLRGDHAPAGFRCNAAMPSAQLNPSEVGRPFCDGIRHAERSKAMRHAAVSVCVALPKMFKRPMAFALRAWELAGGLRNKLTMTDYLYNQTII
jgi:hypothetical protein